MSMQEYYINEEEGRAAEIISSGSSFLVKMYDVGSVSEEEFKSFDDAEDYVLDSFASPKDWAKCDKNEFDRMLADQREEGDAILEDWYPGFTTDEDFDDFPSFMSD